MKKKGFLMDFSGGGQHKQHREQLLPSTRGFYSIGVIENHLSVEALSKQWSSGSIHCHCCLQEIQIFMKKVCFLSSIVVWLCWEWKKMSRVTSSEDSETTRVRILLKMASNQKSLPSFLGVLCLQKCRNYIHCSHHLGSQMQTEMHWGGTPQICLTGNSWRG